MGTPEEDGIELAKEGVKNLLAPVADTIRDLLGPSAKEIGLGWGDSFRVWRLKRVVRLLEDLKQVASRTGLKLKPVAPKILFPILEASSLEDNEDLHKLWVALLTNAAVADSEVLPPFPDILRHLTPKEVRFLDKVYRIEDKTEYRMAEPPLQIDNILLINLQRLGLVDPTIRYGFGDKVEINDIARTFHLTGFGQAFVRACRLPSVTTQGDSET